MSKKVLIFIGAFFPGYKIGGPGITIKNIISNFANKNLEFYIFCPNHDWGETSEYTNVKYNEWIESSNYKIFYADKNHFKASYFKKILKEFDIIYCTGALTKFSLCVASFAKKYPKKMVYIAPMGSFFKNAIKKKSFKKIIYFKITKLFNIFKNCTWSVTDELEEKATIDLYGKKSKIIIAQDSVVFDDAMYIQHKQKPEVLKIVFMSRIHETKGLLTCFKILKKLKFNVTFDIYGTIEDKSYFELCNKELELLPKNISCVYCGTYQPENATQILSNYDILLLPTWTENFGHIIFESLKSSCIPVISDRTPWNDIYKNNAGYVFDLNDLNSAAKAIEDINLFSLKKLNNYKENCFIYAKTFYEKSFEKSGYRNIFR